MKLKWKVRTMFQKMKQVKTSDKKCSIDDCVECVMLLFLVSSPLNEYVLKQSREW